MIEVETSLGGEHLLARQIETLFESVGLESVDYDDRTYGRLHVVGLADTFMITGQSLDCFIVNSKPEIDSKFVGDPDDEEQDLAVQTLEIYHEPEAVARLIYIHGTLTAGITGDGRLVSHHMRKESYSPEEGGITGTISEILEEANNIKELGILPIFTPGLEGFSLNTAEDTLSPQWQKASNFITGRLLQYDPETTPGYHESQVIRSMRSMGPRYEVNVRGEDFLISGRLADISLRPFFLLYSNKEEQRPTVFYQSNSHATWRALLARGSKDAWLAKGMLGGENTVDAPIELQKVFSILAQNRGARCSMLAGEVFKAVPESMETGYAALALAELRMGEAGIEGVDYESLLSNDPKRLFKEGKRPDFTQQIDAWSHQTDRYGQIKAVVYPSRDEKIQYLVYEAENEGTLQRWIATAQIADATISNLGIPQIAPVISEELLTPPIDHKIVPDGYAGYERRTSITRFEQFMLRSLAHAHRNR